MVTPETDSRGLFYKMTYWFIAHAAWFVYTSKTHFLWVILPPKHIRSGLADLLLIRMMKNPSLHYNHKPSRSFQQDLRKHTNKSHSSHPPHAEHSVHVPLFSNTESIHIHSWKNTYQLQKPSAAGLLTLSHGSKLRDDLSDKLRLNRHLRMQPHIPKTYVFPKRWNTIAYYVQRSCRILCRDRISTVRTDAHSIHTMNSLLFKLVGLDSVSVM